MTWKLGRPDPDATLHNANEVWKSTSHGESLRPVKRNILPVVIALDKTNPQTWGIVRHLRKPKVVPPNLHFAMFIPIHREWVNSAERFELPDAHYALLLDAEQACRDFDFIVTDEFSNAPADGSCTAFRRQTEFQRREHRDDTIPNAGLRDGDLVFFRPASAENVASVSISSIWREGLRWMWRRENVADSAADLVGPEQRPMDPDRAFVTLAEKMFGWVGDVPKDKDLDAHGWVRAYKGRVRVSDAVSARKLEAAQLSNPAPASNAPGRYKAYYPLKILSSPKPPCPEFYLTDRTNAENREIRNHFIASDSVGIQGWKFYVVNPETLDNDDGGVWKTKSPDQRVKQKAWVRPLRCGTEFWFHVDFENLTRTELQLLCYALCPDKQFYHRCGFAKPLGLGTVQIEPDAIAYIDHQQRYVADQGLLAGSKRFSRILGDVTHLPSFAELPLRDYASLLRQGPAAPVAAPVAPDRAGPAVAAAAKSFADTLGDRHQILLLVGTPPELPPDCLGISYPRRADQDGESDIFRWFAQGNRDKCGKVGQLLTRLGGANPKLPLLDT